MSYQPLWITLVKKKLKKKDLFSIVAPSTITRMVHEEYISLELVEKLCNFLQCSTEEIFEFLPDELPAPPDTPKNSNAPKK